MTELASGNIFIGLDGGGANILDVKHNRILHLDEHDLGSSIVSSVIQDQNKNIWLGAYTKGLKCFDIFNDNALVES